MEKWEKSEERRVIMKCPECEGEGYQQFSANPEDSQICQTCEGEGEVDDLTCSNCNGSGEGMFDGTKCSSCKGSGVVSVEKERR